MLFRSLAAGAHAGTDVTGFGLLGHALGMARGSRVGFRIDVDALPVLEGAAALAAKGVTTASTRHNRQAAEPYLRAAQPIPPVLDQLLHDPQTSGGLLLALPPETVDRFLLAARASGARAAARIGSVVESADPYLELLGHLAALE